MKTSSVEFVVPNTPERLNTLRSMFREYAEGLQIGLCFQRFESELAELPGDHAPPRGALLMATVNQELAGCCALRPLDTVDYPNACEMKRLYIRPLFRRHGVGRQLAEAILDCARVAGYACVLLDTLNEMESARTPYEDLGFEEIEPKYHNPIEGAHYLKVNL